MIVYAETSAILSWLLGAPSQKIVLDQASSAARVVTLSLTGIECSRELSRARALKRITTLEELAALRVLEVAEAGWDVHDIDEIIPTRARTDFAVEPVRTLDALHLATALVFYEAFGELLMLSFDDRVRDNATSLGMLVSSR